MGESPHKNICIRMGLCDGLIMGISKRANACDAAMRCDAASKLGGAILSNHPSPSSSSLSSPVARRLTDGMVSCRDQKGEMINKMVELER